MRFCKKCKKDLLESHFPSWNGKVHGYTCLRCKRRQDAIRAAKGLDISELYRRVGWL